MAGFNFSFNLLPPSIPASLTNTLGKGVPAQMVINGVTYFLLRDDDTNEILRDDDTNQPLYDEAA